MCFNEFLRYCGFGMTFDEANHKGAVVVDFSEEVYQKGTGEGIYRAEMVKQRKEELLREGIDDEVFPEDVNLPDGVEFSSELGEELKFNYDISDDMPQELYDYVKNFKKCIIIGDNGELALKSEPSKTEINIVETSGGKKPGSCCCKIF